MSKKEIKKNEETSVQEEKKGGVYIDKAEAEAFLEQQRKKKLRSKIITTVVCVVLVLLVLFIAYKVIFGGNVGDIKYSDNYLTKTDVQSGSGTIAADSELTKYAEQSNKDGGKTELWFSAKDSLIIIKATSADGTETEIRSWPAPTEDEMDPATKDDAYPKYAKNHDIVASLVRLGYSTSKLDGGKEFAVRQIEDMQTEYYTIQNGFAAKYTLPVAVSKASLDADAVNYHYEMQLIVEFTLDSDGCLSAKAPANGLVDGLDCGLDIEGVDIDQDETPRFASITFLPFMNSARQGDDGYFVTPDGSGALTYFDVARISQYDEYSKRVYGYDDTFDTFTYPNMTNETVSMAAYGVVKNSTMMVSYATQGDAASAITMGMPGMKNLNLYYINFKFNWREYYVSKLSNSGEQFTFLEAVNGNGDFEQKYDFYGKQDGEFTYADVAAKTQEYLIEKWGNSGYNVNTLENKEEDANLLNVKMFFTDKNQASVQIFSQFKVMTTFAQAKGIISNFSGSGAAKVHYSMLGWQNDGYYGNITKKYSIESAIGGKSGLKELTAYATDNSQELAADVNTLILYSKPKTGISLRSSVVKNAGTEYLKYKLVSNAGVFIKDTEYYYMSPLYYNDNMLESDIENLSKLGIKNVDLEQVGNLVYSDRNKENALLRQQEIEYYRSWILKYQETFDNVSVYYGYEYAASVADNIFDIPTESSKLFLIDESVPFVEIVYHGLVDYYCSPINRTSDETATLLKAIEYGAFPAYEVTEETTEELKYTGYNSLFRAQYASLYYDMLDAYTLANNTVAKVQKTTITAHYAVDIAADDHDSDANVYCTEYANGIKIYVNYGSEDFTATDAVIPAKGVAVIENGAVATYTVG